MRSRVIIIAGPNGAGKTTFASQFLPNEAACPRFINADLIAAGLSPFDFSAAAVRAGKLMLSEMRHCVAKNESFAFETTLSGRTYAGHIPDWRSRGYRVELIFLRLRSARLAVARVRQRAEQGGHFVPATIVRRRFRTALRNFHQVYQPLVDRWELYDNSGTSPILLASGENR